MHGSIATPSRTNRRNYTCKVDTETLQRHPCCQSHRSPRQHEVVHVGGLNFCDFAKKRKTFQLDMQHRTETSALLCRVRHQTCHPESVLSRQTVGGRLPFQTSRIVSESAAGRKLPIQRGLACPPESPNADSQPPIEFFYNADSHYRTHRNIDTKSLLPESQDALAAPSAQI